VQGGPKQAEGGAPGRNAATLRSKPSVAKDRTHKDRPGCSSLEDEFEEFLAVKNLRPPPQCYDQGEGNGDYPDLSQKTSQLKFVIAFLPDPAHTHLSTVFDQFAIAIQEGAQDENFDFDRSWFPWDDEDSQYALLADEKAFDREKELKENEPGVILFRRKTLECVDTAAKEQKSCGVESGGTAEKFGGGLSGNYRKGLVVFVVGEEATHGIHRDQFQNALAWIAALQPGSRATGERVAILGPTFSGSLPSLTQALSQPAVASQLQMPPADGQPLAIYSGSVSNTPAAKGFQRTFGGHIRFHSFLQDDDTVFRRFCGYIGREQFGFSPVRIAILSEDETAYGAWSPPKEKAEDPAPGRNCYTNSLKLYYPRDISALRGAYQAKSLFESATSSQPADAARRNLPSDLADPTGKVHDSIRNYGGNQTPLTQEAFLLEIVAALREFRAQYIFLRSSNFLDQLFLTNFLRRSYPDGRVVIFGSDLMFIRASDATGLNGTMTLSTYPLFPLERDWTEHSSLPAADRVFSADTSESTYVAFRLLLNDRSLNPGSWDSTVCHVRDGEQPIFLPSIACSTDPPIPDYSAPFWLLPSQCGEVDPPITGDNCPYFGPSTWLGVIGGSRFWPVAALSGPQMQNVDGLPSARRGKEREQEPGGRPGMPLQMGLLMLAVVGFSLFHNWCCWQGSYTAKPAFRAHFASTGDWRQILLVFCGSCCVAFFAIVAGWGCGMFSIPAHGLAYPWPALIGVVAVCGMSGNAILGNYRTARMPARGSSSSPAAPAMAKAAPYLFVGVLFLFCGVFILPVEWVLTGENRVLTYWRAMHLASGVSPIVPVLFLLAGFYLAFWFTLHGLALFGMDRPCLPPRNRLVFKDRSGNEKFFLKMFSEEDAATRVEDAAMPLNGEVLRLGSWLFAGSLFIACAAAGGVPIRSLGAESYSVIFLVCLDLCCTLAVVEAWRLYEVWVELRRLLTFLDRLPLRRTLSALHGFSWGGVWKMSGNVLEVRYKVISRQLECMNHTIASLRDFINNSSDPREIQAARNSLAPLMRMRRAAGHFAEWYSENYAKDRAADLAKFRQFQLSAAAASGTLLTKLCLPAWRNQKESLIVGGVRTPDEKDGGPLPQPPQALDEHIRNAEEFICLTYLSFVQNVLGRLRTMAMTVMLLFLAATLATSVYPFDPRQALSAVLILLFVVLGGLVVKVYAEMHRDATLSHVTNTNPGELGTEFWFKIVGFGFAPVIGLMTRIFPGMADFVFSWLQPGISSLK